MANKLLIAAGTALYKHLPKEDQRPQLANAIRSVAQFFVERLGYTRALQDVSDNPESAQLRRRLDDWFASKEREFSDWVVLYYTGHGVVEDTLYLLTSDSERGRLPSTAFPVSGISEILTAKTAGGEHRRTKRVLVILETCHSGAGVLALASKLSQKFFQGVTGSNFYMLAAAFPDELAGCGALGEALVKALNDESIGGPQQKRIYFDQLIPALNDLLRTHKVVFCNVASPDEEQEFFPNPRYVGGLAPSELEVHWRPRARGVDLRKQGGWYFIGRDRVLRELAGWLVSPSESGIKIVTGSAGSGKSAILAKIVVLSDPKERKSAPTEEADWAELFPENLIDVPIHAKGKTLKDVIEQLAAALKVERDDTRVLHTLESQRKCFRIVIDALDEAKEPEELARKLLNPMNSFGNVKVLVGTRPDYVPVLTSSDKPLNIDNRVYAKRQDLAKYVEERLLRTREVDRKTPYRDKRGLAKRVAYAVSRKAYPNFLHAQLIVEDLLAAPAAATEDVIQNLPETFVVDAFTRYLARFDRDEQRVRDMLAPLAWAEGRGLPWSNIWPALASDISNRKYEDSDVHWIFDHAGTLVVESLEQKRSVYRLFHQALADSLRKQLARPEHELQQCFVRVLASTVLPLEEGANKNWRLAEPYVRKHLATHAVAAGIGELDKLLTDPGFLVAAEPDHLLGALPHASNDQAKEAAHVYRLIANRLHNESDEERAAYLEMTARQCLAKTTALGIRQQFPKRPWTVAWEHWQMPVPHQVLNGRHLGVVNAIAVGQVARKQMIVSGGADGMVRLWDLISGQPIGEPIRSGQGEVEAIAVTQRQGRDVIVSGGKNGPPLIWDLLARASAPVTVAIHRGGVKQLHATTLCGVA